MIVWFFQTPKGLTLQEKKQMKLRLIKNCGLVNNEEGQLVSSFPFVGKEGEVIDEEDQGYYTSYPTGYEPVYYLIDFGTEKLWIPYSMFMGYNYETGKDQYEIFLREVK